MKASRLMGEQVRIDPAGPVIAGTWGTWRIVYTAGTMGIAVGGGLEVAYHRSLLPLFRIEGDWTTPQCDHPTSAGYTTAKTTGKAKTRIAVVSQPKLPDHPEAPARTVRVMIEEAPLLPGEELIVTFGDAGDGGPGTCTQHIAQHEMEFTVLVDYEGQDQWAQLPDSPRLDILGGPAERLRAYAPSIVRSGEEFSLLIRPLDAFGHPATGLDSPLTITANGLAVRVPEGNDHVVNNLHLETPGVHRITVSEGWVKSRKQSHPG